MDHLLRKNSLNEILHKAKDTRTKRNQQLTGRGWYAEMGRGIKSIIT